VGPSVRPRPDLRTKTPLISLRLDQPHIAQLQIQHEHRTHGLGFSLVDRQRSAVGLVAQRHWSEPFGARVQKGSPGG